MSHQEDIAIMVEFRFFPSSNETFREKKTRRSHLSIILFLIESFEMMAHLTGFCFTVAALQLGFLLRHAPIAAAFMAIAPTGHRSGSSLLASYDHDNRNKNGGAFGRNTARTDLRNFLTQRSIQSFVYLLGQCHEGHTVRWLERKLESTKIDSFHGTGAFNTTRFPEWDSLFLELANQDPEKLIIEITTSKKSHRGWGNRGTYIDSLGGDSPSTKSSSPPSSSTSSPQTPQRRGRTTGNYLASLKSNLSKPSKQDGVAMKLVPRASGAAGSYLDSLSKPNLKDVDDSSKGSNVDASNKTNGDLTLKKGEASKKTNVPKRITSKLSAQRSYLETLSSNAIEKNDNEAPAERVENPLLEEKTVEYEFDIDPASLVTRIISVREQIAKEWKDDLTTLVRTNDQILDDYEEKQRKFEKEEDYKPSNEGKDVTYNANAMVYLANSISRQDRDSTPFRRSNFDLLVLLSTQESIHRVLQEYREDNDDEMHMEKYEWLHSFYKENIKRCFDGHDPTYGRGDKFLDSLLARSPAARETKYGGFYLIDPVAVAEDILRERSMVSREWKAIVATIPDEHIDLRRILFTRHLMESSNWNSRTDGKGVEESQSRVPDAGAFE